MTNPKTFSDRFVSRFWHKVQIAGQGECWPWRGYLDRYGYGKYSNMLSHRLAWLITNGDPGSMHVLHTCDVRDCCNPRHLFLGTNLDNMRDCDAKGRRPRGEWHYRAKLNLEKARRIRRVYAETAISHRDLALQFGVKKTLIGQVLLNQSWPEVPLVKRGVAHLHGRKVAA